MFFNPGNVSNSGNGGTGGSGDGHTHSNLSTLNKVTESKLREWDNKSNFSGSYNDLTNKPTDLATESYVNQEIEKTNAQLSELANKGTTVEVLERATKEEIKRQIADGTIANLTLADNSVEGKKIKNNEIKLSKLRNVAYEIGKNLFDKNSMCYPGKGITSTGVIGNYNWTLVVIPVEPNTQYAFKHNDGNYGAAQKGALGYLDSTGDLLSFVDMNTLNSDATGKGKTFITPEDCCYVAKNGSMTINGVEYIDNFQLEKGSSVTDFEEHSKVISEIDGIKIGGSDKELATKVQDIEKEVEGLKNTPPIVAENSIDITRLKDVDVNYIDNEGTNSPLTLNLFNKNTMIVDGCLANNNGKVSKIANSSVAVIPVSAQTTYSLIYVDNIYGGALRGKLQFSSDTFENIKKTLLAGSGEINVSFDSVDMSTLDYTDDGRNGKIFVTPSGTKCIILTVKYNSIDYTNTLIVQKGRNITADLEAPIKPQVKEFYGFDGYKVVDSDVRNFINIDKFYGKRWAIFGDSLSQPNTDGLDKYHDRISKRLGMSNVSYAVGGSGYMKSPAIYTRIAEASNNFDIVSIMAGVNEKNSTLGTIDDVGTDTLCGCVKKAISDAQEKYPLATIFVMTSIPGETANPISDKGFDEYCKKIKEICELYGVPCLDLFHMSGLKPWIPANKEKYYRDYIHLVDEGQEYLSKIVFNFLNILL